MAKTKSWLTCPKCGSKHVDQKRDYTFEGSLVHAGDYHVYCTSCGYASVYTSDFLPNGIKGTKKILNDRKRKVKKDWQKLNPSIPMIVLLLGLIMVIGAFFYWNWFVLLWSVGTLLIIMGILLNVGKNRYKK